ncbi:CLUMA_CG006506, isoform A [Clunio marinus]|uniref:Cytochrome b5 domain-containing protein 1 n=1 Tax=Clunio marinus TaxID=568069 RepID=A0A1J1HY99_9DIPT|nr:CLUMA_CG006506, isoform A [Clunio marinus]
MDFTKAYYTRDEVVTHNTPLNIWVIIHGFVYDLTSFVQKQNKNLNDDVKFYKNLRLLLQYAGKDLSCWFNDQGEPLERINQHGKSVFRFLPAYRKENEDCCFWWNKKNIIGKITSLERYVRIVNTLTRKTVRLSVCEEDSIETIMQKYKETFNSNSENYIVRKTLLHSADDGQLFIQKTLTENRITYEKNEKLGLPAALWLFYILNKD